MARPTDIRWLKRNHRIALSLRNSKRNPNRYPNEVGARNRSIGVGQDAVIVSKADLEGYKTTIELLSDRAGGKKVFESIAEADRLPENLILEKLNAILAWHDVRGEQPDRIERKFRQERNHADNRR